jgi:hypothetical protein
LNVAAGGLAEEAVVFAIELAGAFVADFEGGGGGVDSVDEHAAAGGLQTELLLILKRAHGGQGAEMMMQGAEAHAGDFGEFFDAERLGVVAADPGDCFGGAVALVARGRDGAEAAAFGAAQDAVDDFALNEGAEKRDVLRFVEEIDEAAASVEKFGSDLAGDHGAAVGRSFGDLDFFLTEKFADDGHVEFERHGEAGLGFASFDDLADDGEVDGGEQVFGFAVKVRRAAEVDALAALGHDGDAGLVGHRAGGRGGGAAMEGKVGNGGCPIHFRADESGDFAGEFGAEFADLFAGGSGGFVGVLHRIPFSTDLLKIPSELWIRQVFVKLQEE